jgi:predicted PurR-regulated permease PerM
MELFLTDPQLPRRSPPRVLAPSDDRGFGWRVVETTAIVVGVLLLASLLWFAADVLLLLFAAVLLATLLRAATNGLVGLTGLTDSLALALVVLLATSGLIALGWVLVPQVIDQIPELIESLGATLGELEQALGVGEMARDLADGMDLADILPSPSGLLGGATGLITSTFGVLANLVIVSVLGIYLAANPDLYLRGVARLVPPSKRVPTRNLLEALGHTLRWWMVGQLISMTAVGVLSYVGLSLLGVPLALTLAVVAFFLTFIPFIGPLLSAIPVILVAFSQSPTVALYAFLLYTAIQMLEGYVLTPNVQRRSVSLPPALTIAAQVLLGVLLGALGVTLATPLAAAGMVAVNRLYVEEVLEDDEPHESTASRTRPRAAAD